MGNDPVLAVIADQAYQFQSTFPHGERHDIVRQIMIIQAFQSTFPHGERPGSLRNFVVDILFQSTFPHGERRMQASGRQQGWIFQSTFPHGERRCAGCSHCSHFFISIHVPAWGTTVFCSRMAQKEHYFNPRSRMGNDRKPKSQQKPLTEISIHVPAWGTTELEHMGIRGKHFNPRSRMGNDEDRTAGTIRTFLFQSTFPHGERQLTAAVFTCFRSISIHVPAWGTT